MTTDELIRELLDRGVSDEQTASESTESSDDAKAKMLLSLLNKTRKKKTANTPDALLAAAATFHKAHQFTAGQLVTWKKGMKNRRSPDYGEPAIVIEVLTSPLINPGDESGTPYFREPLDIIIGTLDSDGDLLCFHYDSRRFEPYAETRQ
jgi:hypothetical protein